MSRITDKIFARGREFLGCDLPVICGAMTWISEPKLVSTVCNEGAFACLAGGNMPPEVLARQMEETRKLTSHPFAVNLVTLSPAYHAQLDMLLQNHADYVVFAGGIPRERDIAAIRETGAKTLCFASTRLHAERMIACGADALVLEGAEAGGHVGQVTMGILLQQVMFREWQVPVFIGGGITSGRLAAHLMMMGASGVQLGTRFAVSTESCAHPAFKEFYLKASARDAAVTPQFDPRLPVAPVRCLHNPGSAEFDRLQLSLIAKLDAGELTRDEAQHELEHFWIGGLRRAVQEGDLEHGSLMAGQSVGNVTKIESVHDILTSIRQEMETEFSRVHSIFQET